ncbi:unnamed protein product [Diabrotica balteata]|uniref:Cytochrome c oxidase assembly factor 1 homolog n=1 Tax=Diabrotica balteata TaxID=107213 RepID=A0A9N9SZL0_DIABA|nr:unnamed protein product [Diabrotica balteata]
MPVSNMTLVKIAALGGFATVTMAILYKNRLSYNVSQTEFYKEALKIVRSHKGAVTLLGEPIRDRDVDVSDMKTNFVKDNTAQYKVPLKGSKQNGHLYFWALKNVDKWDVTRMELELDSDSSKRLVIKSSNENRDS